MKERPLSPRQVALLQRVKDAGGELELNLAGGSPDFGAELIAHALHRKGLVLMSREAPRSTRLTLTLVPEPQP